jgi:hypothetical protein
MGMKISLNQQFYTEDWNILTFYNKATVAIPCKVKMLNCLHEFSHHAHVCNTVIFAHSLDYVFNMPHNPWSAVSLTITLKATVMIRINLGSPLPGTC